MTDERRAALWSGAMFFCLLAGYFLLRPIRDLMGVRVGFDRMPELFRFTLAASLLLNPVFSAAVSRWSRRRFIPWAYRTFAVMVLGFAAWAAIARGDAALWMAKTYFVWLSVFNLFVVSVFWGFMADVWRPERAKRLYGRIALGGTVGALLGSFAGLGLRRLPEVLGLPADQPAVFLPALFVVAALWIEGSVRCMGRVTALAPDRGPASEAPVGGGVWEGMLRTVRSPYLSGIAGYVFLYTVFSTLLYFVRLHAVETSGLSDGQKADLFFWSEVGVQAATLAIQYGGTAAVLVRVGLAGALASAPLVVAGGAGVLLLASGLWIAVCVPAIGRIAHFAFAKPASEALYTVVPREEKYKSKSLLDTFVYRLGDQTGAEGARALGAVAAPSSLPLATLPVCAAAAGLGVLLARMFRRKRAASDATSS